MEVPARLVRMCIPASSRSRLAAYYQYVVVPCMLTMSATNHRTEAIFSSRLSLLNYSAFLSTHHGVSYMVSKDTQAGSLHTMNESKAKRDLHCTVA